MTRLMQQVIERLRALPDNEQDEMANFLLSELEDDARWNATTAKFPDAVKRLAQQVRADHAAGLTEPLDPNTL